MLDEVVLIVGKKINNGITGLYFIDVKKCNRLNVFLIPLERLNLLHCHLYSFSVSIEDIRKHDMRLPLLNKQMFDSNFRRLR